MHIGTVVCCYNTGIIITTVGAIQLNREFNDILEISEYLRLLRVNKYGKQHTGAQWYFGPGA